MDPEEVAWRDRLDSLEECARRPRAEGVEEQVDAHRVRPRRDQPRGQQRLDLRAPEEPAVDHRVIQRADAHAVTSQDQGPRVPVPERDGELAPSLVEDPFAVIFIEVHPQLGVATGGQPMPPRHQLGLQLGILEDLPVLRDPDGAVFIADRLPASRQVDDRQPACPHRQSRLDVDLFVVRPAMSDRAGHREQPGGGELAAASQIDRPSDTAHLETLSTKSVRTTRPHAFRRFVTGSVARDTVNYNIPGQTGASRWPPRQFLALWSGLCIRCMLIRSMPHISPHFGSPRRCPIPTRSKRRSSSY